MIVVETVLYVVMVYGEHRKAEDRVIRFSSDTPTLLLSSERCVSASLFPSGSLEQAITDDFSTVPEVQRVMIERDSDDLLVWVAIDNPDRATRDRIFDKQLSVIDAFPEINFDFNLVPYIDKNLGDVATSSHLIYSRQA